MEITGIETKNLAYFQPMIFGGLAQKSDRLMLGAIDEGIPVAACVVDYSGKEGAEGSIQSIFTAPDHRRLGAASLLLDAAVRVSRRMGCRVLEMDFLDCCEGLGFFLEKHGFLVLPGPHLLKESCQKILDAEKFVSNFQKKKGRRPANIFCMDHLDIQRKREVAAFLEARELRELLELCMDSLSFVSFSANGKVDGMLAASLYEEEIRIELLLAEGKSAVLPIRLIQQLVETVEREGWNEYDLSFVAVNSRILDLIRLVFGGEEFFRREEQEIYAIRTI